MPFDDDLSFVLNERKKRKIDPLFSCRVGRHDIQEYMTGVHGVGAPVRQRRPRPVVELVVAHHLSDGPALECEGDRISEVVRVDVGRVVVPIRIEALNEEVVVVAALAALGILPT